MSDSSTQAPTRLLDEPALEGALRQDLDLASSQGGVAYDVEAGLSRFEQTLEGLSSGAAATAAGGGVATGARVLAWILGAAVLVGGGVGATWMLGQRDAEQVRVAAPGPTQPDKRVRAEDAPVAGASSSDASGPPLGARSGESVAEAGVRGGAGDAGAAPAQPGGNSPALDVPAPPRPASESAQAAQAEPGQAEPAPSLADEARLINGARKALERDPAEALALVEEAARLFPSGAMIQERRGYEVLALVELGRAAEAEQRGDAYLQRWPKGTLSRRVRDALGR